MSRYHLFEAALDGGKIFMADRGPRRGYYVSKERFSEMIITPDFEYGFLSDYPKRIIIIPKEFT